MRSVFTNDYRIAWRDRRRRNCLTETTRTRFRRAILIKSRSRLRSSSRVTRYCDLPTMAASKISSSSGSRQSLSSPEVCTSVAQAAIKRINTRVQRRIFEASEQSRSDEYIANFGELGERCDGAEFVEAPRGDNSPRRAGGLKKSRNPDVGVKQSDERHGGLPLPRP